MSKPTARELLVKVRPLSFVAVQALAAHEHPDYDEICSSLRLAIGVRE